MPLFSESMENHKLSNNYTFSAVPVDELGASEYTPGISCDRCER